MGRRDGSEFLAYGNADRAKKSGGNTPKEGYPCITRPSSSFLTKLVLNVGTARLKHLGKRMAAYCRSHGYDLRDVPHRHWGSVKSYPVSALKRAANLHYFGDAIPPFAVETSVPKPTVRPEVAVRLLMGNLDGQAKATLWNILYRRALGCGAGEYRDRNLSPSTSGALWKQLEPPLVRWFESCLAWIAANHHSFSSLDQCFGRASEIIPLPSAVQAETESPVVEDLSPDELDILAQLYRGQNLTVDDLPYSPEIEEMARSFATTTGRRITARQIYRASSNAGREDISHGNDIPFYTSKRMIPRTCRT